MLLLVQHCVNVSWLLRIGWLSSIGCASSHKVEPLLKSFVYAEQQMKNNYTFVDACLINSRSWALNPDGAGWINVDCFLFLLAGPYPSKHWTSTRCWFNVEPASRIPGGMRFVVVVVHISTTKLFKCREFAVLCMIYLLCTVSMIKNHWSHLIRVMHILRATHTLNNIGSLKRTPQYYYHATSGEPCKGSLGVAW